MAMAAPRDVMHQEQLLEADSTCPLHTIARKPVYRASAEPPPESVQPVVGTGGSPEGTPSRQPSITGEAESRPSSDQSTPNATKAENETQSALSALEDVPEKSEVETIAANKPGWCPKWLQKKPLAFFAVFYLGCAATLPILLWKSQRDDGIAQTHGRLVYLWRFGPTAVLTLVATLWSRVELQVLRYIFWTKDVKRPADGREYTQMLQPMILLRSIQRGHYLVFLVVLTSILLQIQVLLGSGLFQSTTSRIPTRAEVSLLDHFDIETDFSNKEAHLVYYMARGLSEFDVLRPFGLTEDAAYQTFSPRGTADAPLNVVVDAIRADVRCEHMESLQIVDVHEVPDPDDIVVGPARSNTALGNAPRPIMALDYSLELFFENCVAPIPLTIAEVSQSAQTGYPERFLGVLSDLESLGSARPCESLPQHQPQFLYLSGKFEQLNATRPDFTELDAVVCSPSAWLSKVQVIDDGVNPQLVALDGEESRPVRSNYWRMLLNSIPEIQRHQALGQLKILTGLNGTRTTHSMSMDTNPGPIGPVLLFGGGTNQTVDDIWTHADLYGSVMNYSMTVNPMLSHLKLRQDGDDQVPVASREVRVDRLRVNIPACVAMTAMFTIALCITLWMASPYSTTFLLDHQNPATILGFMKFLRTMPPKKDQHDDHEVQQEWATTKYTPLVLRSWCRMLFTTYTLVILSALPVALFVSKQSDGFADVQEDSQLSLLWTSIPVLVLLLVSLHTSSADTAVRDRVVFTCLKKDACAAGVLDESPRDMLGVRALFRCIHLKVYSASFLQAMTIVCGFLAPIGSLLFAIEPLPGAQRVFLEQQSWFGSRALDQDYMAVEHQRTRSKLGSLTYLRGIADLTWPQNTYNDLLFPALENINTAAGVTDKDTTSMTMSMPAARLQPSCRRLARDTEYKLWERNDVGLPIKCPNGSTIWSHNHISSPSDAAQTWHFAQTLLSGSNALDNCPESTNLTKSGDLSGSKGMGERFRLGWFRRKGTNDAVYTVGQLGDDHFKYIDG